MARTGSPALLRVVGSLVTAFALLGAQAAPAAAGAAQQPDKPPVAEDAARAAGPDAAEASGYADGEIIVRFEADVVGTASEARAHARAGGRAIERFASVPGLQVVEVPEGSTVEDTVAAYSTMAGVLFAQPNYRYTLAAVPDDPAFGMLWGLDNTGQIVREVGGTPDADIDAPEAWDLSTGSSDVVVAVLDTGLDRAHDDLAANVWVNTDEVPANGLDDDGNGYIDDVHGIDTGDRDSDTSDVIGHGTHVAGTIGASGDNGLGVTGVNWNVTIMPVKIFDAYGSAYSTYILEALEYAKAEGARVVNCSWGGGALDSAIYTFMQESDQLYVCAAGNDGLDADSTPFYPAAYDLPNIISVGASDADDAPAYFSNYGATSVDLFAPGTNISSTVPGVSCLQPAGAPAVVFSDDCSTLDAWLPSVGLGGSSPWSVTTAESRTAPASLAVLDYHDNELSYLDTVQPLDLTATTHPWLEFYLGMSTEYGYDWVSWGLVDTSADPDTYVALGRDSGASAGPAEHYRVDLSDYAGSGNWQLRFVFASDVSSSSADGYRGPWLDDVRVSDTGATGPVLYENAVQYDSTASATLDWSTARTYTPWAYSLAEADWYYATSQSSENTWLFLKNPIDLTSGPADLSLDIQYQLPGTYMRVDGLRVYASHDNVWDTRSTSTNTMVASFSGSSPEARRTISLAEFAGDDSVWIAFQLVTAAYTHPVSARIDDLLVTGNGWSRVVDHTYAYDEWSGTSMAAPHVSGIAALLLARDPGLTAAGVKSAVMGGVDARAGLAGLCVTGGRANAYAALALTNRPPVAADDAYSTRRGALLTVTAASGLLANDSDPDMEAGPLVVEAGDLSAAHGTVTFTGTDGSFTYQPDPGFAGEGSFTYVARDPAGAVSAPATVRITVEPPALMNVYRFYNRLNGSHFYTASAEERAHINATWPAVYADEGVAYSLDPARNDAPLYRFYNRMNGSHFYTASAEERARVIATWPDVYTYEGPAYNVALTDGPSTLAIYRFYNRMNGSHFYTASAEERDRVIATWPDVYQYENVAFFVRQ